jgi:hypothetical protein
MVRGFFIFIIFICKKSVWVLANKKYPRLTGFFKSNKRKNNWERKTKIEMNERSNKKKFHPGENTEDEKQVLPLFVQERLI